MCNYTTTPRLYNRGSGAIVSIKSTLTVNGYSLFIRNTANFLQDGRALAA